MEELTTILEERRKSINELSSKGEDRPKFQFIEQQRKRNERQNWILRILKSLKVFSAQQKRIIHETVIKVMNYHNKMQLVPIDFQSSNFLELMINLFVEFFNKFEKMDYTQVKSIIRPNNNFIIVDLLKELIELGRKQFKIAVQNHYKEQAIPKVDKKLSIKSLIKLPLLHQGNQNHRQSSKGSKRDNKIPLQTKIKYSLLDKYKRCIDNFNPDYAYQKINQVYFDLLYLNQRNSVRIQKYMDSCYGAKRHINYNTSGLYTQQEIKRMLKAQEEKTLIRAAEMKELRGQCSAQQLKEYFKMQVQMHENKGFLPVSAKPQRIRQWFPICLIKNGDKLHPYNILVEANNTTLSIREYEQKSGKKIRVYMKELLQQLKGEEETQILTSSDFIKFNRKQILDYNNNKILELLMKETPIVIKKDGLLPIINNHSQQDEYQLGRKVKSQTKLPHKSLIIPNIKLQRTIDKQIQTRLNYSSIVKEINIGTKRKIDTLIDQIIKTRQKKVK